VNERGGEIDLIMREGRITVFVEVRYRRSALYGGGAARVAPADRLASEAAACSFTAATASFAMTFKISFLFIILPLFRLTKYYKNGKKLLPF